MDKYPKYAQATNDNYEVIKDILSIDYTSISPGGKRMRVFKQQVLSLLRQAFDNVGHKNYLLDLVSVFTDTYILNYLCEAFGNKSKEVSALVKGLYHRVFAWQGYEGVEWKRLANIERYLS